MKSAGLAFVQPNKNPTAGAGFFAVGKMATYFADGPIIMTI